MGHTLVSLITVESRRKILSRGLGNNKKEIKISKKKDSKKLKKSALKSQKNHPKSERFSLQLFSWATLMIEINSAKYVIII